MSRPLIIAFMFSLVLHGGLLCLGAFPPTPRPPVLRALLRLPPDPEEVPKPIQTVETLFKNTIENGQAETPDASPLPQKPHDPGRMAAIRQKLSEYVFYPEQAWKLGLEGTVTLFVEVSADGRVEDVRVVASSGHPMLDNAAIKGFYALGRLPTDSDYWEYTFELE
jgi:protein TonB